MCTLACLSADTSADHRPTVGRLSSDASASTSPSDFCCGRGSAKTSMDGAAAIATTIHPSGVKCLFFPSFFAHVTRAACPFAWQYPESTLELETKQDMMHNVSSLPLTALLKATYPFQLMVEDPRWAPLALESSQTVRRRHATPDALSCKQLWPSSLS